MKAYFIQLFDYDHYENKLLIDTTRAAGDPAKPVQLLAHLLTSQQVWLARCKGEPTMGRILWPEGEADTLLQTAEDNYRQWIDFLDTLEDENFDKVINYKDMKGNEFGNKLSDILAHVINHGTHHRAQVGQHLKLAGVEQLPLIDYIFYLRQLK